jgi:pimeloyl-ACP methyl ester carboxylesterase
MGGALAQEMALYHPSRVLSLTAISTTAGAGDPDLPGMAPIEFPPEPDWSDRAAVVEYLVASQRAVSGDPFDEEEIREIATLATARTKNPESSAKNHYEADDPGGPWRHRLPEIKVPTLVIHGEVDPLFPLPHGEALAREIPGARLVVLPDTGHEFPSRNWPLVAKEILALTA